MYAPMTPARAVVSVVAMLPVAALWFLIPQPATLVGEHAVEGTVLNVSTARMQRQLNGTNVTHVAQVELPDGGKARVWLRNARLNSGDVIKVRVRSFDDGHREVLAAY